MTETTQFKRRNHFMLLGVIPSILFLIFVVISLSWQQNVHQTNAMQSHLNHSYHMFYGELYEEAKVIKSLAEQVIQNREIQDIFMKGDREGLQQKVGPIYKRFNTEYDVSHCYFHTKDKTVFLRVHYPSFFGDSIDRFTLNQAARTEAVSYGLELGPLGTLTLRVVVPWQDNGQLIGFLELGIEIDKVIDEMKKILEEDIILVVNKEHLDENKIVEGYGENKPAIFDWDRFSDVVVFGMTMDQMPPLINSDLAMEHYEHESKLLDIYADGRHFLAGFAPLYDASDKDIGDIVIIRDYTELRAIEKRLTLLMLGAYVLCILLYLIFIFAYLNRLKRKVT